MSDTTTSMPTKSPGSTPNPAVVSQTPHNLDSTSLSADFEQIHINFESIQGNIFGGFNKDFQTLLFLHFTDPVKGRAWLNNMSKNIASSEDVINFNNLFKTLRARHRQEGLIQSTWTNIAFTFSGLQALEAEGIDSFPDVYKNGMAANAVSLGDTGNNGPTHWVGDKAKLGSKDIHAILIIASDLEDEVDPTRDPQKPNSTVAGYIRNFGFNGTVKLLHTQRGRTRLDIRDAQGHTPQAGHEHFGFKDGVSQPGIRGIDVSSDLADTDHGNRGQDLLHPGEFVLGYPMQIPTPLNGHDGPNPLPGDISGSGPEWTRDGSYLVFRRLRQDVKGFRDAVKNLAPTLAQELNLPPGTDATALMGAKLVGRYASGCPLERLKEPEAPYIPSVEDPGVHDPTLANDDAKNNFFEFGYDPKGLNVPRGAHIRKAYPRDQEGTEESGTDSKSRTQTHRILRRGIPFGSSLGAQQHGEANVAFPNDRGLLFLCYQSDLERQFEFVQKQWINEADFPCPEAKATQSGSGGILYTNGQGDEPDGEDPIIAQTSSASFGIPISGDNVWRPSISHFVAMTGGDYFFAPSIEALSVIARSN